MDKWEEELVKKVFPKDLVGMILKEEKEEKRGRKNEKQNAKRRTKGKSQMQGKK